MSHQVTITYNRELIYRAVKHFWVRTIAWHGFVVFGLSIVGFLYLLVSGDRSWLLGVSGVASAFGIALVAGVYWVNLKRSLWKFEKMESKSVQWTFTEDSITTTSDLGTTEIAWKAIEQVWRFPDAWLLFVSQAAYVTLPLANVDTATRSFIEAQVLKHGGKVS